MYNVYNIYIYIHIMYMPLFTRQDVHEVPSLGYELKPWYPDTLPIPTWLMVNSGEKMINIEAMAQS